MELFKSFVNWLFDPVRFFFLSIVGLWAMLAYRRVWTRPSVATAILLLTVLFALVGMTDPNFRAIMSKPDNLPIPMMLFGTGFFLWLALRQAARNDDLIAQGQPPAEGGDSKEKVFVWPDLVYIEFLVAIVCFALLILWAVMAKAPLEQPANPGKAPNPSKAPWYFLGLQEMLVYFDPWAAGVVFPSLIIVGLMAIPYIDFNKKGSGYYTFKERSFAISVFLFGYVVLWVLLIMLGTIMRGPNWNFFGPFEAWDLHKVEPLVNVDLSDMFWASWLNMKPPKQWFIREAPGLLLVLLYFALGPLLLLKVRFFKYCRENMGAIRYGVFAFLLLSMASLPIKMILRWTLNLKYVVHITEFFFNI